MEQSQEGNKGEIFKAKAADFMNLVKQKAPVYWKVSKTKVVETWRSGTKGKAICVGTVFAAFIVVCMMFGGGSKDRKIKESIAKSQSDVARIMEEAQAKADAMRKKADEETARLRAESDQREAEQKQQAEAQRLKDEELVRQRMENERRQEEARIKMVEEQKQLAVAEEKAAEEKQAEEYAADSDQRAREIMSGTELWGNRLEYAPEKKLSYNDFIKGFYTIEDAFIPRLGELLVKFHSGQVAYPAGLSQIFIKELGPRIDHLLYYCCRTGLSPSATSKEKVNYVKLLSMAQMEKALILTYALAFGQDSKDYLNDAENKFSVFSEVRKSLPAHKPADDAEERYAELPYPSRPVDLNAAATDVDCNTRECERYLSIFLPMKMKRSPKEKAEEAAIDDLAMKKVWRSVEISPLSIKSFCGLEFGETRIMAEKALGECVLHDFSPMKDDRMEGPDDERYRFYGKTAFHVYKLKKPFRKFTRAVLRFEYDGQHEVQPSKQEFEALRSIQLEADIAADVNYQSCLDELVKVKKLLEEKYKLDLGKGQPGEEYLGQSYWYGAGLSESGWIVLGIRSVTDGHDILKDGRKTMVLEVRYADSDSMIEIVDAYKKKILSQRAAEKESKKQKLNISDNAGADVL